MVRLVAELLLELRHLRERMLEPAVLEQDARMAGERHEQLDVGLGERADVAETLADHEQAERPVLAAERRDDRVLEPAGTKERVEGVGGAPPREQHRRADASAISANAAASSGANRSSGCMSNSPSAPLTLRSGPASSEGGSSRISAYSARSNRRAATSSCPTARPNSGAPWVARIDS